MAIVPTVVLGELHAGFAAGSRKQDNLSELETFLAKPGVQVYSVTAAVAARYGSIFHALRRAGHSDTDQRHLDRGRSPSSAALAL